MDKKLFISFFALGLSSIFSQVIFLRETILTFYGNEFFIGVSLSFWVIWVALGSLISQKFLKTEKFFPLIHFLVPLFLLLEIILLRSIKIFGLAGEIPNFLLATLFIFFVSLPACFLLGSWWSLGTKFFAQTLNSKEITNKAYFLETLGFFIGGILFSFFCIKLNEFLVLFFLLFLNSLVAIYIFPQKILIFFFLLSLFTFPFLKKLNFLTFSWRFKNQNLIEFKNTPFGNIAVTKINDQFNFYQNGVLLGSNYEFQFAEEFSHLTLLQKEEIKKVLLVGGGCKGTLKEILKEPVNEVYYLELDPGVIEIITRYLKEEKIPLSDKRVKLVFDDGFHFLKKTNEKFDFVLIDLPSPSTILLNRFYTLEFFQVVKDKLKEDGIFTFHLPFSPSGLNKNLENLNRTVFQTLKKVFKEILILPEENIFFLASEKELIKNPEILVKRYRERKIETRFLTENLIRYRYSTERINTVLSFFESKSKINTLSTPISYFYQILFWQDTFSPKFTKIFEQISFNFGKIAFISLIVLFPFLIKLQKKFPSTLPLFSMFTAGFSIMALENLILISFQNLVGYLYFRISFLISLFMLGMALGVYFWSKQKSRFSNLVKLHLLLILFLFLFTFYLLSTFGFKNRILIEGSILNFAFLSGFLGGGFFPLINQIYLSFQKFPQLKTGTVYAFDLFGSFLGSFLTSLILLPISGFFGVLFFLCFINFLSLGLIFILNPFLQKPEQ